MEKTSSDYVALMANSGLSDLKNADQAIKHLNKFNKNNEQTTLEFSRNIIWDLEEKKNIKIILTDDTKIQFINPKSGESYKMLVCQANGGRHSIEFIGNYKWNRPSDASNSTGSHDIFHFACFDNTLYGSAMLNFV